MRRLVISLLICTGLLTVGVLATWPSSPAPPPPPAAAHIQLDSCAEVVGTAWGGSPISTAEFNIWFTRNGCHYAMQAVIHCRYYYRTGGFFYRNSYGRVVVGTYNHSIVRCAALGYFRRAVWGGYRLSTGSGWGPAHALHYF